MKLKEEFAAWKQEHPTAYRRALLVLAGFVLALVLVGWVAIARAATMTLDCPGGTFVATTGTLSCVQPPSGGGGGGGTIPPPGDFDGCPANAVKVRGLYPVAANGVTPYASPGQIMSIKMAVPTGAPMNGDVGMQFLGTYSGSPSGEWALSEKACDLNAPLVNTIDKVKPPRPPKRMTGFVNGSFAGTYNYGPAGTGGTTKVMEVGRTYYLNIRFDGCSGVASCGFEYVKLP